MFKATGLAAKLGMLSVVFSLAPTFARAARYDPDADRAVLRQTATSAHTAVVEATGLSLELGKVPAISAGLDEGLRQARLSSEAAHSLDAAARRRAAEMEVGVKADLRAGKINELSEPITAERQRWERLSSELKDIKSKVDDLPKEIKNKIMPLVAAAVEALQSADESLRPLEQAVKALKGNAFEMKGVRREALVPLGEVASSAADIIAHASDFPAQMVEAKTRLGALDQTRNNAVINRIWETFNLLRDATRLIFQAADRACNRAADFHRLSATYEKFSDAFEKALEATDSGPATAKLLLNKAQEALTQARERLK